MLMLAGVQSQSVFDAQGPPIMWPSPGDKAMVNQIYRELPDGGDAFWAWRSNQGAPDWPPSAQPGPAEGQAGPAEGQAGPAG